MVSSKFFTKKHPEKSLCSVIKKNAGRSSSGRISVRHQGGEEKRFYRLIDFGQEKINIPGKVISVEYDPNRTSFICLVEYQGGQRGYVLSPKGMKVGDEIICAEAAELKPGNRTKLKNIPIGSEVFNIEVEVGRGGIMARGAGASATVLAQETPFCHIQMPSGESRKFSQECFATVGTASNEKHTFENLGKAGRMRHKGVRPRVRGTAMIPASHPHGGGNGKTTTGMKYPKTPWGKPARGVKTRKRFWTNKFIIKRRVKKNKK
jgi:large subunit ribosomal protein L2